MNQLLGSLVLFPFEQLVNRILAADSHLRNQLQPFIGKSLQMKCSIPRVTVTVLFEDSRVRLLSAEPSLLEIKPTASISGTVADLLSLLLQSSADKPLSNPAIVLEGDATFIQDLYTNVQNMDIDWEDYLAPLLGDVVTNEISRLGGNAREWSHQARTNVRRNIDDYLKEESQLFPHSDQLDSFNEELHRLRLRIDRVKAKADRLYTRLDRLST